MVTDFDIERNDKGEITGFYAFRKAPPRKAIEEIIPLYKKLNALEETGGMKKSREYLENFLEDKNLTYDEYIDYLLGNSSIFKIWFKAMKKIFK